MNLGEVVDLHGASQLGYRRTAPQRAAVNHQRRTWAFF